MNSVSVPVIVKAAPGWGGFRETNATTQRTAALAEGSPLKNLYFGTVVFLFCYPCSSAWEKRCWLVLHFDIGVWKPGQLIVCMKSTVLPSVWRFFFFSHHIFKSLTWKFDRFRFCWIIFAKLCMFGMLHHPPSHNLGIKLGCFLATC